MDLNTRDKDLIAAIEDGLPFTPAPYAAIGAAIGMNEDEVIERLGALIERGVIRRFGVIVRHHEIGYRANAMAVWDVPDAKVREAGHLLADLPYVTLSYRRPRRLPDWPYNLFCMIHGRERAAVEELVAAAAKAAGLAECPSAVLFSRRRFKQRGPRYSPAPAPVPAPEPIAARIGAD